MRDPERSLLDGVLRGKDGRIRASYRAVLPFGAFFASLLLSSNIISATGVPASLPVFALVNILGAVIMAVLFYFIWAKRWDRRPVDEYGIDLSVNAIGQWALGFITTVIGTVFWYSIWIANGSLSVDVVLSYNGGSFLLGVLLVLLLVAAGAIAQDLAFLGLMFVNSKEGIQSRFNDKRVALSGAFAVTGVFFLVYHFVLGAGAAGYLPPLQAAFLLLVGLAYITAVYVCSGSLFVAAGSHAAINFGPGFLLGWERMESGLQVPIPEILSMTGTTPVTSVLGANPVMGLVISFALLVTVTRTEVVEMDSVK